MSMQRVRFDRLGKHSVSVEGNAESADYAYMHSMVFKHVPAGSIRFLDLRHENGVTHGLVDLMQDGRHYTVGVFEIAEVAG